MTDTPTSALSPQPSAIEREAFAYLQGRMVELLLRHDVRRLGGSFATRLGALFDDERHAALRPYRELAVLLYLRDELLDSILPRIKRRLSFLAPRELVAEGLPPRGRIDWPRTMAAGLRDRPGEPPLDVRTRQRRRHFATPENLLTVATIIEYRDAIQSRLDAERAETGARALRHPLREVVERCTRELAFPQFTGLVRDGERIVAGYADTTTADLEQAVDAHLLPGHNSAYDDLLAWRRRLAALRMLDRDTAADAPQMLGADPARDNYLYQIWLYYELAELLDRRGLLEPAAWEVGKMRLRFRWGAPGAETVYQLKHDQAIDQHWRNAPGVRPDLYIERATRAEVRHNGALIWREPGYVLDAKYYKPRDSARAPAGTVKRMIADLHLTGERHGALLFAFQSGERPADADAADLLDTPLETTLIGPLYRVTPETAAAQVARPDAAVAVWRTRPRIDGIGTIQAILSALLDEVHVALQAPAPVACHGIFIDSLSAGDTLGAIAAPTLLSGDGQALRDPADILICPKPHIGPWRADLVSRARTCCQDGRLCHIAGQAGARPPVRPPRSAEDLLGELQHLFERGDPEQRDDVAVSAVARRVEALTRRFAEISGAYRRIEVYYHRLRDMGLQSSFDQLAAAEQESLALAVFLVEQLDSVGAHDFSAPAIHVSSVLEVELARRVEAIPGLSEGALPGGHATLGTLMGIRRKRPDDWARIRSHLRDRWRGAVDPDDPQYVLGLDSFVEAVWEIRHVRNDAAHTSPVPRETYSRLFRNVCQAGPLRIGALRALLAAWPV
ncbi:hypothetical protein K2Z83_21135 [Oscillochloris sp. ZM17-4]|uniref:hypothetical protein n=1 Tax=Oscillochloris sp. ZM17-4 TaxID=2866714 RepID=UPI001C73C5A4|nr:hypothetical protein [Oscillochloris sp. ZM17-4]MBX0330177.1 hypothetical protein [Oscillochloris sp. ZM17-4]